MRVLHVIPDSAGKERHRFLGSTKDALGRTEYFEARGIACETMPVPERSDERLREQLRAADLRGFDAAVLELPLYPKSIAWLRRTHPALRIFTRAINAEFLHQLHLVRSHRRYPFAGKNRHEALRDVARGLLRLRLDRACARRSHALLSITEWESRHYWRRLAGAERVRTVPYFLPRAYVDEIPRGVAKANHCVCMLSTSFSLTPFPLDAASNFGEMVRHLGAKRPEWEFSITGSLEVRTRHYRVLDTTLWMPPRVRKLGFVESPLDVLAGARVMAVLSDLGYGFKTKILDAILSGCHVLVTARLLERLPEVVRPHCLVVDLAHPRTFFEALDRCRDAEPAGEPNTALRGQAFAALDALFAPAGGRP